MVRYKAVMSGSGGSCREREGNCRGAGPKSGRVSSAACRYVSQKVVAEVGRLGQSVCALSASPTTGLAGAVGKDGADHRDFDRPLPARCSTSRPGILWNRELLEGHRCASTHPGTAAAAGRAQIDGSPHDRKAGRPFPLDDATSRIQTPPNGLPRRSTSIFGSMRRTAVVADPPGRALAESGDRRILCANPQAERAEGAPTASSA